MYGENLVIKLARKNQGCIKGITKKNKKLKSIAVNN